VGWNTGTLVVDFEPNVRKSVVGRHAGVDDDRGAWMFALPGSQNGIVHENSQSTPDQMGIQADGMMRQTFGPKFKRVATVKGM